MPSWTIIITVIVALGFLRFAGASREVRVISPMWILLVSVYILPLNRRLQPEDMK